MQEKEIKSIWISKEEIKLSLFANNMSDYVEHPKESIQKKPSQSSKFSKVTEYKMHRIQDGKQHAKIDCISI